MKRTLLFGLCMLLLLAADMHALGVTPARTTVDFHPGQEETIRVRLLNNERIDFRAAVYVVGDMAEYIELPQTLLTVTKDDGEIPVIIKMKMPDVEPPPGPHLNKIVLLHLPENYFAENEFDTGDDPVGFDPTTVTQDSQLVATLGVVSQILVNVPYPGTYAKAQLHVTEGNVGEPVIFTVSLFNFGDEPIRKAYARVRILGANNEEITEIKSSEVALESQQEGKVVAQWGGASNPGAYFAEVYLEYDDEQQELGSAFSVGRIFIRIKDLAIGAFQLGGIAKLDFSIESDWNEPIAEVKGEVTILDEDGVRLTGFSTLDVERLEPRTEEVVAGYWDTAGVDVGEYDVNLDLLYQSRTSSKLFETVVSLDEIQVKEALAARVISDQEGSGSYNMLVVMVMILIIINIAFFLWIRKRKG